ncbi:E3 ubiquitin-protein ligase RHF2A isoform X2 [Arachis duranensis]|uniref:RING-type E3 ubiquitin transferase n=1 Tax=Arachis duranensis TaxID=130453 RepID=A0A9C6WP45_ARADU|nr:E3 ubiquitin-protein ligase RHF2A isoform X2 [Arachis duranensis]
MEVPGMEGKAESQMTSAAAFVEGGIQESCDDACSICLEDFSESDPSTTTACRHEFHLQCVLEWCQRSSQCPMCWQPISMKDPTSQELFEAVERERKLRAIAPRTAAIFHHPAFGDFGLQHLGISDADLEQRIIQHLAAAAAVGRSHHHGRREGHQTRASAHGHPPVIVLSSQPSSPQVPESAPRGGDEPATNPLGTPSSPMTSRGGEISRQIPHLQTQSSSSAPRDRDSIAQSSPANQDRAGPSESQSISDSLRARFSALSMRYKESISKGARGWKERLFCHGSSMSKVGSEARREAGIAGVTQLVQSQSLQNRATYRTATTSLSNHLEDHPTGEVTNQNRGARRENASHDNTPAACSASSRSN